MWSGSVTTIYPLAPMLIIAKFFSNSHPIAPAPTTNVFRASILLDPSLPITIFKLLNYSSLAMCSFSIYSACAGVV